MTEDEQIRRLVSFIRYLEPTITQWQIADIIRGENTAWERTNPAEDAEIVEE